MMEYIWLIVLLGQGGLLALGVFFLLKKTSNAGINEDDLRNEIENLKEILFRLEAEKDQIDQKRVEMQKELENTLAEKNTLSGQNKVLFAAKTEQEAEIKHQQKNLQELHQKISSHEAHKDQLDERLNQKIQQLEKSQATLETEKNRLQKEDLEQKEADLAQKTRVWNDHENRVLAEIKRVANRPQIQFEVFTNQNLPDGFDGSLKPDAMIGFMDQYLIFDAKFSGQKSPQQYFRDQVKKTAVKLKDKSDIYPCLFFVVPENRLGELSETTFYEGGFQFSIVPVQALEPLMLQLRRVADFQNLSDIDPHERENLVNILAHYDRHISFQNAANILLAQQSVELMNGKKQLSKEFQESVGVRKKDLRDFKIKDSDLKKMSESIEVQQNSIKEMVEPRASVDAKVLQEAQDQLSF